MYYYNYIIFPSFPLCRIHYIIKKGLKALPTLTSQPCCSIHRILRAVGSGLSKGTVYWVLAAVCTSQCIMQFGV